MIIAKIGNDEYVGFDAEIGFTAVKGIENAYCGVEGELDESADILGNGNFELIEIDS